VESIAVTLGDSSSFSLGTADPEAAVPDPSDSAPRTRPNFLFIMADDHASHAISAYGSHINKTPGIDRLADGGMRFDNCFCVNAICSPSRAAILTGTYNHVNGVTDLDTHFDGRQSTFPKLLQAAGYQTAIVGKWHLGHGGVHDPTGFNYWDVLPGQGEYHDPELIRWRAGETPDPEGERRVVPGYVTDVITDLSLDWLRNRDPDRPFMLKLHHKAPHRHWEPAARHAHLYEELEVPVPPTFDDDYSYRASAARNARMRIEDDLGLDDLKASVPDGLSPEEAKHWKFQRYIKDYLRCVAAIDENVSRVLDWLDEEGLTRDTVVVYTSDQGFFLGDHGWYDKRFMYEESLRMPFLLRYPREVREGALCTDMVLNVDVAPTFLELAGIPVPAAVQGHSIRPLLHEVTPADWRTSMYYRYWMHLDAAHEVQAHYGIRTDRYKLIRYEGDGHGPEWELFDLREDPLEIHSVHDRAAYASLRAELTDELHRLQAEVGDAP
jgi:arylsulfatase A-like enzyme